MRRSLLFLCAVLFSAVASRAQQLTLNLALQPPYSPYFSDYLSIGNKALLTITNSGAAVDVFFRGSITGDNGVSGATNPNFRPGVPNTIAAGPAPIILRGPDFESYFNFSNFQLRGITQRELISGAGLPEGNYTVCLQAFDYSTGRPVSNEACFVIPIVYPEPPVPMTPLCNGRVVVNPAQQVMFSWAPSPGAPPRTRYVLKMAELVRPDQDPYDALNTLTTPPFFETETTTPAYSYRRSDPVLTPGRRYAWGITAYDPTRQTLFRNNGISPACVFTYGDTGIIITRNSPINSNIRTSTALALVTPACKGSGNGILKSPDTTSLVVSAAQPLTIAWSWPGVDMDTTGGKVSAPKIINGKTIAEYRIQFTPLQQIGKARTPVAGATDKLYTTGATQSQLYWNISQAALPNTGLVYDHWYTVTVAALGSGDSVIATTTSCPWMLRKGVDTTPMVTLRGVIAYRLQTNGTLHPANHAAFALRLTQDSLAPAPTTTGMSTGPTMTVGGVGAWVNVITDDSGRFAVSIPASTAVQDYGFVQFMMKNAHYAPTVSSRSLDLWTRSNVENPPVIGKPKTFQKVALKSEIQLGQIAADAYAYDLTVRVSKGFPGYYYSEALKGYTAEPIGTDSLAINPAAKLKPGMRVQIYRYKKTKGIPYTEGTARITETPGGQGTRYIVAEGLTATEKNSKGEEIQVVRFTRLLVDRVAGYQYYMQAVLPKKPIDFTAGSNSSWGSYNASVQGALVGNTQPGAYGSNASSGTTIPKSSGGGAFSEDADDETSLEAPEVLIDFPDSLFQKGTPRYTWNMEYKLISTKPPMSEVRGKLMYRWPGQPNKQVPLANARFVVRTAYLYDGGLGFPEMTKCELKSKTIYVHGMNPNGIDKNSPQNILSEGSGGLEVGIGETDATGAFTVRFLNYDQKGLLSDSATALMMVAGCGDKDIPKAQKPFITALAKKDWISNPALMGEYVSQMEAVMAGMPAGSMAIHQSGLAYTSGGAPTNWTQNEALNPTSVQVAGAASHGLYNTGTSPLGAGAGAAAGAGKAAGKKVGPGPFDADEDPAPEPDGSETSNKFRIDRILIIELQGPHADHYENPRFIVAFDNTYEEGFAVQPFEKRDIGTLVSDVREWSDTVYLKTRREGEPDKGPTTQVAVNNAKLVIYREAGAAQQIEAMPVGEGSAQHPMKPLIAQSMVGEPGGAPVEWIVDTGFTIGGGNMFTIGKRNLLAGSGKYMVQIAPNPNGVSTLFNPITLSFNSLMAYAAGQDSILVTLAKGKVTGRVMDSVTKMPIGGARVRITHNTKSSQTVLLVADDQGYWEYSNDEKLWDEQAKDWKYIKWSDDSGDKLRIDVCATHLGYGACLASPVNKPYDAPKLGLQTFVPTLLSPPLTVTATLVDGEDKAVKVSAYVVRTDTTVYHAQGGVVKIRSAKLDTVRLRVVPEDLKYFDTTLAIPTKGKGNLIALGEIRVPQRLHRIRLDITRRDASGTVISPAGEAAGMFRATINGDSAGAKTTVGKGNIIEFVFANVSVNNYTVVIESTAMGAGYIPQIINLKNEESRDFVVYPVTMKKGASISGTVRLDGVPVRNARVYVDHGAGGGGTASGQSASWSKLETRTNASGIFTLAGIPKTTGSLVLRATLDTAFAVSGDDTTIKMGTAAITGVGLDVKKAGDFTLATVWGFPFSAEKIEPKGKDKYLVSGLLTPFTKAAPRLASLGGADELRMVAIEFERKQVQMMNGQVGYRLVPTAKEISFDQTSLKMKYTAGSGYNVELSSGGTEILPGNGGPLASPIAVPAALSMREEQVGTATYAGIVDGTLRIVDNSYNYPSTYLSFDSTGDFYLARPATGGGKPVVKWGVLRGGFVQDPFTPLLTDRKGDSLRFKFMGFAATASPTGSQLLANGKMKMDVRIRGKIPGGDQQEIDIALPSVILDGTSIAPTPGNYPLEVKLQDWTLKVYNWTADPVKGGIHSKNAVIETGVANLQMQEFNLRSDLFVLQGFNPQNITLGAVKMTDLQGDATLVFDQKVGSDKGRHWRFNLTAAGDAPAANIFLGKPGETGPKLGVDYMQLISYNNENIITIRKPDAPLNPGKNPRIKFWPTTMASTSNTFTLYGDTEFDVPAMPQLALGLTFTPDGNNGYKQTFDAFNFVFDGKGQVKFTSTDNKTALTPTNPMRINGGVEEPGSFTAPIKCQFSFGSDDPGTVTFLKNQTVRMVGDSTNPTNLKLHDYMLRDGIVRNGMRVEGGDWTKLAFSGQLIDPKAVVAPTNMDFIVHGAILGFSDTIRGNDIKTPLGNIEVLYDLKNKEMIGTLKMDKVKMGSYQFTGDAEMRIGWPGIMTLCAGQLNTGTLIVEGFGTFSAGLVLGSYKLTEAHVKKVIQFSKDPRAGCWLNDANATGFQGFYFTGGYDILNKSESVDFGIAAAYFKAQLGVEAMLGYSKKPVGSTQGSQVMLGIGAHGKVNAGMSAITGTSIKGGMVGHLTADAFYAIGAGNYAVNGAAEMSMEVVLSQYIPFWGTESWTFNKAAGAYFTYANHNDPAIGAKKGASFDFFLGNTDEKLGQCEPLKEKIE